MHGLFKRFWLVCLILLFILGEWWEKQSTPLAMTHWELLFMEWIEPIQGFLLLGPRLERFVVNIVSCSSNCRPYVLMFFNLNPSLGREIHVFTGNCCYDDTFAEYSLQKCPWNSHHHVSLDTLIDFRGHYPFDRHLTQLVWSAVLNYPIGMSEFIDVSFK